MAIPTADTLTADYLTAVPAWEKGVEVNQIMAAKIFTGRSGLEQRTQRRGRASWEMSYLHYPGSGAALNLRRKRMEIESRVPLWVPWWPHEYRNATSISTGAGNFTLADDPPKGFFLVGEKVAIETAGGYEFRTITGLTNRVVSIEAGSAFPTLTRVWPCKLCIRNNVESRLASDVVSEERISIVTLQ